MPDRRRHKGPHPEDPELFDASRRPSLRAATHDLSWLFERGYKPVSGLKLVGDRYGLTERQRTAVARCACADSTAQTRRARMLDPAALSGERLELDGFNVLTTLEVALSGGVVLVGRDGVLRDIAGVHGSYRRVEETRPAIAAIDAFLRPLEVRGCRWLLDRPVSNSGRLRAVLLEHAAQAGLAWEVEVVPDPDVLLAGSSAVVCSADGQVLDRSARSFNLARACVQACAPGAFLVDLSIE
jgi:hypothetical protein